MGRICRQLEIQLDGSTFVRLRAPTIKLATLNTGTRDGQLVLVDRDLTRAVAVPDVAPTLQAALDRWPECAPRLRELAEIFGHRDLPGTFGFAPANLKAPLPRAYHWADGSAYLNHVELVRKARGAEMPQSFWTDPLIYQGGGDDLLGPAEDAAFPSEALGIDLEAEVAVITDEVPMGADLAEAERHIQLVLLVNDWSLRHLIPAELAKGFGFYQSKPSSAFSPAAVSIDELGSAWSGGKVHLPLVSYVNGELLGQPNAGQDMTFDFPQLIVHAARTRRLRAGTIIGSGTVSNHDRSAGCSCIVEKRTLEQMAAGRPVTPFLKYGDRVRIEMLDSQGRSIFGAIDQKVVPSQAMS